MATSDEFPCILTIDTPFPTHRLASAAIRSLSVDQELSPLVRRQFSLHRPSDAPPNADDATVLRTVYRATTNRMLRVSVNGFFESLNVVLQVMQELDVDVLQDQGLEDLQGAQGVEQGMIGTTKTGA
ncbi:Pcc1-domain-containing protein [Aureobasidium namibiae CBS 147.97]|uniref:Pcc1-domain-containing protein n=1 Tax=Aureobasidium namibiae CBS 147.97 TaxID=1043004 RepID=A0A074WVB1_9PEZI